MKSVLACRNIFEVDESLLRMYATDLQIMFDYGEKGASCTSVSAGVYECTHRISDTVEGVIELSSDRRCGTRVGCPLISVSSSPPK
jgi:hypothetical protein